MNDTLQNKNIGSPLKVSVKWSTTGEGTGILVCLSAFLIDNQYNEQEPLENIIYLGSQLNKEGKLTDASNSIVIDIPSSKENKSLSGSESIFINFDTIPTTVKGIRLNLSSIIDNGLSFYPLARFSRLTLQIIDSIDQEYTVDLLQEFEDDGIGTIDLGIISRYETSWRFETEMVSYYGGLDLAIKEHTNGAILFKVRDAIRNLEKNLKQRRITTTQPKKTPRVRSSGRFDKDDFTKDPQPKQIAHHPIKQTVETDGEINIEPVTRKSNNKGTQTFKVQAIKTHESQKSESRQKSDYDGITTGNNGTHTTMPPQRRTVKTPPKKYKAQASQVVSRQSDKVIVTPQELEEEDSIKEIPQEKYRGGYSRAKKRNFPKVKR